MWELSAAIVSDVAASAQEAIADALVRKAVIAAGRKDVRKFYLAGGVAANGRLRKLASEKLRSLGMEVSWPDIKYCTDNAAMIACAGMYRIESGRTDSIDLNIFSRGELKSWR